MKLVALAVALALSACSSVREAPDAPSFAIHNPAIYATQQPLVDDNGMPLAVVATDTAQVATPSAKDPFPWASGTSRVAD
ncbi:hypothetical protein [Paracidovorax anthurii]|uniref:Uncharacterized protein n=1 Tax=Paracidovorax anthurii TaxID=78229 RepID=A0A328ZDG9_9BURK|nr:hypothetical protein [Paracidovorax anthurii]RAR84280.1 hypothetical protein AX018_101293 [Paracidovorax anthurii]